MDNIWAPWRMEFIKDKRLKGEDGPCVFCELWDQRPNNQNLILAKGKENYVLMNRFPYNNGHLLIVPYQHIAKLKDLPSATQQEIMWFVGECMEILEICLAADGFNCGLNVGRIAGCGILDHAHWHVVPRWTGDTNFFPVLSDTRAMPEYLSATYDKLADRFRKLKIGGDT